MITQFDNQLINSFLYYLDHKIINNGSGYLNKSSLFYPINQLYGGYQTYSTPFNQFICDQSINGPNIINGVYISGVFVPPGASGLHAIDYFNGRIYTSGVINGQISGNFAIKDFNIKISDKTDEEILIENNYWNRLKTNQNFTGLYNDELSYPVIYIKNDGGEYKPFQFGDGNKESNNYIRALILADSQWSLDAVSSLMKDLCDDYIPLISQNEIPFNVWGSPINNNYNYLDLTNQKILNNSGVYIKSVQSIKFDDQSIGKTKRVFSNKVYFGTVDFEVCYWETN